MSKSIGYYIVNMQKVMDEAYEEIDEDPFENIDEQCIQIEHEEKIYWDLFKLYKVLKTMDWSFYEAMDEFE